MATTPPPPKRIRTPPTPLHGPQFDSYEPYSPRRSSRIAGRTSSEARAENNHTPRGGMKNHSGPAYQLSPPRTSAMHSRVAVSPPSSPSTLAKGARSKSKISASQHSPQKQRLRQYPTEGRSDTEATEAIGSSSAVRYGKSMLPTPAKTPRKGNTSSEAVSTTSRILFPGRAVKAEDAMPPMRKYGRGIRSALFSEEETSGSGEIAIYTDSKERIPTLDKNEDNPFIVSSTRDRNLVRQSERYNKEGEHRQLRKSKELVAETAEMEKMVQNDEGIIYVFRGRKIFRRFDDKSAKAMASPDIEDNAGNQTSTKRKAGSVTNERFTRSSITPRLLFPSSKTISETVDHLGLGSHEVEEDEEAETDIELPDQDGERLPSSAERTPSSDRDDDTLENSELWEPAIDDQIHTKRLRPLTETVDDFESDATADNSAARAKSANGSPISGPRHTAAASNPFHSWQRTKTVSRNMSRKPKRDREAGTPELGRSNNGKRVRSVTNDQD